MENNTNRASSQVVLGLLVVGMGVLFLLDNLDILNFRHAIGFWPLAFIVAGAVALFGNGSRSSNYMGGVLVAIGVLMIAGRMGFFYISWGTLWPLVMIALGGLVLFRSLGPGRVARPGMADGAGADNVVDVVAVLGGFERRVTTSDFRGGEITAILGGCELDLREASIVKEAVINVFAIWGGINIKVPPDWTVVLNGTPLMGGFSEKTVTPPDASKRLVITGYAIMGGVEVRN
ncbi:cell wall-active antibiotics response protein [Massilia pinisoli]|uniref:Cell wall-active antibiotics response protein n=1 Tax=Massilia pinisoli TaxID=1772194 RepID=A0ABT1ZS45_9BURK|nr:cell wall-active antibiotics response protein [Massilia pinisoli]MCS0582710.1 cell wall-active antibiotics response protein [Massilia pinisoli]